MINSTADNKRIAKNTLMLYFRMFFTTIIGLYTSRVVLNTLGIIDYGIYNVVGGIVTMAAFLNTAMIAASQRFLAYELGRGDKIQLSKVFCTSINIHIAISIIIFFLAETLGVWFINSKLNIPEERMFAANWVFQASIISFVINVMSVPYYSAIVAHERMSAFAYISILDAALKLLIVYLLFIFPFDKLIVYSILIVFVVVIIRVCYSLYCNRNFEECRYYFIIDRKLFVEMFSFAGWSIVGGMGFSLKDQLSNIILNLFFGPSVNAARGIGIQVSAQVKTFANSFTMALNPQITKQYALGNVDASRSLVYAGSRYSFYLLTLISIPVIINVDYILKLWLGIVPQYTSLFVIFSIIISLVYTLSECVTKAIQATGRIKWFQIGISVILLSELPIAWLFMKLGYPPYAVMWPTFLTYTIALFFRFWLIHKYVPGYKYKEYYSQVVLRSITVFLVSLGICAFCCKFEDDLIGLVLSTMTSICLSTIVVIVLGMYQNERKDVFSKITNRFKKRTNLSDFGMS